MLDDRVFGLRATLEPSRRDEHGGRPRVISPAWLSETGRIAAYTSGVRGHRGVLH